MSYLVRNNPHYCVSFVLLALSRFSVGALLQGPQCHFIIGLPPFPVPSVYPLRITVRFGASQRNHHSIIHDLRSLFLSPKLTSFVTFFLQKPQNSRVSRYTVTVGRMCEVFLENLPVLFTFYRCNQSCKISAESAIDIGPGLHQIRIRLPPDSPIRTDFVHQPV